jgi:hypothetical protein
VPIVVEYTKTRNRPKEIGLFDSIDYVSSVYIDIIGLLSMFLSSTNSYQCLLSIFCTHFNFAMVNIIGGLIAPAICVFSRELH